MDVKLFRHFAWLGSLAFVLALGNAALATADEAVASDSASDSEASSAIFISDDTDGAPPRLPQTVETTAAATSAEGTIVFIEDTPNLAPARQAPVSRTTINRAAINRLTIKPRPTFVEPKQVEPSQSVGRAIARGDLKVVSNQQQPVAALQPLATSAQRELPSAQRELPGVQRELPGDIQIAVHTEPLILKSATPKTEVASVAELLISAHEQSLEAKTAADYSQIVQQCAAAIDQGAQGDQRGFARQLSSWALNRRGQLRADEGEQELANADFQAALDFNPRNWRAMHNRGVSYAQAGKFAEAFDDFNRVIQLNPNYDKAYANRATLYVQAKDLQAAIKDYELAIRVNSKFATAHVGLGRVYHMLSRWDKAIEHYTAAAELEPTSADIFCSRGDLRADMGNYGKALADYARTIELDPDFAHAYRNGAWLLATCPDERFRDPENAVLGAEQALECSYGERHIALDTLAAALASNGQFEEAIAAVTQAVDLAPEDAKFTYLTRLQLYQDNEPFRTEPVGEVSQATYEAE
ncbi:MAG: tetratricopeptide repeat protein [Planctomycetes bacterium]|nr:tetratricopeptide repeat protein [Planctomycetota bacterium]